MDIKLIKALSLGACLLPASLMASETFLAQATGASEVTWTLQTQLDPGYGLQLTVSGPDNWYFQRQFAPGEIATFSPADNPARTSLDGQYNWEITAVQTNPNSFLERSGKGDSGARTLVTSGSFSVSDGTLLTDDGTEEESSDRVVLATDNGIIRPSLCVGSDCADFEAFGFDTIRLKENNLRLHFDDTSSVASFPANDWRIIANDSADGGSSYLAIEDATAGRQVFRVQAGARSNALIVDSQGDVGIGTSTPATDIHVKIGDTPTLRLEQDATSGFSPQTWDVGGNEGGFFVRDATNGSTLPFRIFPGANSQALVIDGDSHVGIGAGTNPTARLHVKAADGEPKLRIE